jgi:hypothetical protein
MAALGIWLWSDPGSFGNRDLSCALDSASLSILGKHVTLGSKPLRLISLVLYSIFLMPGLNLILPMILFLSLYILHHKFLQNSRLPDISPTFLGMGILFVINLVFVVDLEKTLNQNQRLQEPGESDWGFGQILALLLLILPLRDILEKSFTYKITGFLRDAIRENRVEKFTDLVLKGADVNVVVDGKYITPWKMCSAILFHV